MYYSCFELVEQKLFICNYLYWNMVKEYVECTDKYLWQTKIYFNVISIETCMSCIFKYICIHL